VQRKLYVEEVSINSVMQGFEGIETMLVAEISALEHSLKAVVEDEKSQ
jgi:hypothetical protein